MLKRCKKCEKMRKYVKKMRKCAKRMQKIFVSKNAVNNEFHLIMSFYSKQFQIAQNNSISNFFLSPSHFKILKQTTPNKIFIIFKSKVLIQKDNMTITKHVFKYLQIFYFVLFHFILSWHYSSLTSLIPHSHRNVCFYYKSKLYMYTFFI